MVMLTITSRKGGTGKSMIATSLAAALAAEGVDVALLDADPNAGAHRWATSTYEGPAIAAYAEADAERLAELVPALADRHAVLIADTAGFGNQAATVCIAAADAVLIPATPGEADVVEALRTFAYVEGLARSTRRSIPARIIINRAKRNTALTRHTIEQIGEARLDAMLSEAVAFGEVSFAGTIPTTGTARAELAALLAELRRLQWVPAEVSKRRSVGNQRRRKPVNP